MKTDELREAYLAFFESKGCVRRPSDVLVPRWDPSVLFTPAGMNQFKDHFLGRCKLDFTRATTCQKCLRTGDIDNVGRTPYHHTFFEMLGNFSFGDYFKREAITWAWEFLTSKKWLGIPGEKLSVTVYLDDDEAAGIWQNEVGLPVEKIARMDEAENFWPASAPSQGPDGVCGPCSEIYYHTPFGQVEIWNLVFTQFNRVGEPPNNLRPLPSKNIDTGMGLERAASVLQGVESNYHIDTLRPLVEAAGETCGIAYVPDSENGRRLRRIADHVRACAFAIHENVIPGPNKEKYVIKRLLRRAVLDGHQIGVKKPFLHQLVCKVAEIMKRPYPELQETVERVAQVIQKEEDNFLSTIDAGLEHIDRYFLEMKRQDRLMVSGAEAAELYTTQGFPPELFEAMAAEHNFTFDWPGYQAAMEQHGIDSGAGQRGPLFKTGPLEALKKAYHGSEFVGYDTLEVSDAKVLGLFANHQPCDEIQEDVDSGPITVVLDRTPFYGEMGGQVGDSGEIVADGCRFEVVETLMEDGFTLHRGHLRSGKLSLGAVVTAKVNSERRDGIRRAHTATHILHNALQTVLGPHAQQQGSKVDDDLLRFDFPNPQAVSREDLDRIEDLVNARVMEVAPVGAQTMPLAAARKQGAMMLFGEKYPDVVRVVSVGAFSKELCGGTHLTNSGQIGLFKILSEESVSAGTRRITAVTGRAALKYLRETESALKETAMVLRVPAAQVADHVAAMAKEIRHLKKLASQPAAKGLSADQLLAGAESLGTAKLIVAEIPATPAEAMRGVIDQLRKKTSPLAVLLASPQEDGKVMLMAGLTRDLVEKGGDAVKWVKAAAAIVGGGGGGRPDLAQAGGKDASKVAGALAAAKQKAAEMLGG